MFDVCKFDHGETMTDVLLCVVQAEARAWSVRVCAACVADVTKCVRPGSVYLASSKCARASSFFITCSAPSFLA